MRKCSFLNLLIFFVIITSTEGHASNALHIGGHGALLKSEKLGNSDVTPLGGGFHLILGQNYGRVGFEGSFRSEQTSSTVKFDSLSTKLKTKVNTFGAGFYLGFSRILLLRAGLAWSKLSQSVGASLSETQKYALEQAWDYREKSSHTGFYWGAQMKLFSGSTTDLYSSYHFQKINDDKSAHTLGLGLTFKFDLN